MAYLHADRDDTPYSVKGCRSACVLADHKYGAPSGDQYSGTYCALYCSFLEWKIQWEVRLGGIFVFRLSSFVYVFRHARVTL